MFYLIHCFVIAICVIMMFYNSSKLGNNDFNLKFIFYTFFLFFFGIAPMVQYKTKETFFDGRKLAESEYLVLSSMILVILVLYALIYSFAFKNEKRVLQPRDSQINLSNFFLTVLLLICLFVKFIIYKDNLGGLILKNNVSISSSVVVTILNFIVTVFPITLFTFCISNVKYNRKDVMFFLFFGMVVLFTAFPLSISRTKVAFLYFPIFIILLRSRISTVLLKVFFIGSLFYFFPFLNQFRFANFAWRNISFIPDLSVYNEGHYDNYYNFALTLFDIPITYGNQLLGSIFFFVPRSLWNDKPIGSGAYMAELEGLSQSNISSNFFCEGYVNFGFLGIVGFLVFIAIITAYLDKRNSDSIPFLGSTFYCQGLMLFFYMLRGDLMGAISLFTGLIFVNLIIIILLKRFNEKVKSNDSRWDASRNY